MDDLTKEQRHKNMSNIRSKNTKPEEKVRKDLFAKGFRYRKNVKSLPGCPDCPGAWRCRPKSAGIPAWLWSLPPGFPQLVYIICFP